MKTLEDLFEEMMNIDRRLTKIESERAQKEWEKAKYVS